MLRASKITGPKYIHFLAASLTVIVILICAKNMPASSSPSFTHEDVARDAIIIDLHSDAFNTIYRKANGNIALMEGTRLETSIPRLRQGGVRAQFYAIWDNAQFKYQAADAMLEQFYSAMDAYSTDIAFAGSAQDIQDNAEAGKISALLAVEGGEALHGNLERLDYFFNRGARYMTLTWNNSNELGDASRDDDKPNHGLTEFGEKVVRRMNELGMMVDVSHVSDKTLRDVLKITRQPVIATHSNAYAVKKHPRNLKDDLIRGICWTGGIVGVNYHRPFVSYNNPHSVADVADHIDHMVEVGGIECVALGSDYDGGIFVPTGLENAGQLPNLTRELIKRGYTKKQLQMIYGENVLRFMKRVIGK